MKIAIIIQARMGSERLPGKVMKEVLNKPLLEYHLERLNHCRLGDDIVIATTKNKADDVIAEYCLNKGIKIFRGSEDDVLERYYLAASEIQADIIVRATADCPVIDPLIVDQEIEFYLRNQDKYDYVSTLLVPSYPRGITAEVFPFWALEKSYKEAKTPSQHEHVTPYIYQNPHLFRLGNMRHAVDLSHHRWTVDQEEDFLLISKIITALYPLNPYFTMDDILELLREHPDWILINAHVQQKNI
ncbi:MAG: glycosyltransferase family protein [Syntrophomonadaceae bacterium]|jgi:spore coat polysaccharide biosynthesis protein SpsF|nr:glycosyltransferase family protein [Syntrophomonadaceae bacterium]